MIVDKRSHCVNRVCRLTPSYGSPLGNSGPGLLFNMLDISEQGRQIGSGLMFRIYFSGSLTTLKSEEKTSTRVTDTIV